MCNVYYFFFNEVLYNILCCICVFVWHSSVQNRSTLAELQGSNARVRRIGWRWLLCDIVISPTNVEAACHSEKVLILGQFGNIPVTQWQSHSSFLTCRRKSCLYCDRHNSCLHNPSCVGGIPDWSSPWPWPVKYTPQITITQMGEFLCERFLTLLSSCHWKHSQIGTQNTMEQMKTKRFMKIWWWKMIFFSNKQKRMEGNLPFDNTWPWAFH